MDFRFVLNLGFKILSLKDIIKKKSMIIQKKLNKTTLFFIIFVNIIFFASPVFAQSSASLITGSDACEMWRNAFYLGISFLGVAALVGIVWGGFNYVNSYGNQERITSAKETIFGSITGLLIGLLSVVLFNLINPYVLECKIEAPFKLKVAQTTVPGTPTPGPEIGGTTNVKATCKGIVAGELKEGEEGPPAPQEMSEPITLTVQSTDKTKIQEEVDKACAAKCTEKKWDDCKNEITSTEVQAPTSISQCDAPYKSKSKYGSMIEEASRKFSIDPFIVEASIRHESGYNNQIIGPSGERSFGQFMPKTFVHALDVWGGGSVPAECRKQVTQPLSAPYDENTATGFCYNAYASRKRDPYCKHKNKDKSVRYAKKCYDWIYSDEKRSIEILAAELASLKQRCGNDNLKIALAHNTGKCNGQNARYTRNHISIYTDLCNYAKAK